MVSHTKRKPRPVIIHECTQVELLKRQDILLTRLSNVTLGNGHEEDGLLFLVRAFLGKYKTMENDIKEIKGNVNEAINKASSAKHAVEIYKAEVSGVEKEKAEQLQKERDERDKKLIADTLNMTRKRDNKYVIFSIIMTILTLSSILVAIYFGSGKMNKVEKGVENLGTPVVTDSRGQIFDLPEGTQIRMYPKDFLGDTVKKDTARIK